MLKRQEKKLMQQRENLNEDDTFSDPARVVGNADIDIEVDEQVGHQKVETFKNAIDRNLTQVRRALQAIKRGKYGKCDICKREIDPARLRVFPTATLCANCRKEKETEKGKIYRKRDILTSR